MKRHQLIILIALVVCSSYKSFATAQVADRLIYNGDTLLLFSNPLEDYLSSKPERTINNYELDWTSTACYRGYLATWEIVHDSLFLLSVQKGCQSKSPEYFDLLSEFGTNRVFATWCTGTLLAPRGEMLFYIHEGYASIYQWETIFQIAGGRVTSKTNYDNSKSRQSVYSQDSEKLKHFIYSNINWESLPESDKVTKVFILFSANEEGIIDSVRVLRGQSEVYNNEAIRIVKSIPEWDVYYKHGVHHRIPLNLPIVFSEENRKKYSGK